MWHRIWGFCCVNGGDCSKKSKDESLKLQFWILMRTIWKCCPKKSTSFQIHTLRYHSQPLDWYLASWNMCTCSPHKIIILNWSYHDSGECADNHHSLQACTQRGKFHTLHSLDQKCLWETSRFNIWNEMPTQRIYDIDVNFPLVIELPKSIEKACIKFVLEEELKLTKL